MNDEPTSRRRIPAWVPASVAAIAVAAIAGGIALSRHGHATPQASGPSAAASAPAASSPARLSTPAGPASALVVHDGDTVRISSGVESAPGHPVYMCPPFPTPYDLIGPRPYKPCELGIPVTGVDLSRLTGRSVINHVITGDADFTALYRGGHLSVLTQTRYTEPIDYNQVDVPPCAPPRGGWPHGTADYGGNLDTTPIEHYRDTHPGTVIDLALLRPSNTQVLTYVLTSGDPAPVEAALKPVYGNDMCVFRSQYTRAQIDGALNAFQSRMSGGPGLTQIITCGQGLSVKEQDEVEVSVPLLSQSLADVIDSEPAGLVKPEVWMTPV